MQPQGTHSSPNKAVSHDSQFSEVNSQIEGGTSRKETTREMHSGRVVVETLSNDFFVDKFDREYYFWTDDIYIQLRAQILFKTKTDEAEGVETV